MLSFLRRLLGPVPAPSLALPDGAWILVPLGNPGPEYANTRHNLGRRVLQRWVDAHCPAPGALHTFRTGTLYRLQGPLMALVPATYMNLSGQVVAEALGPRSG